MHDDSSKTNPQPLSRKTMVFYGLPQLTHAVVTLPLALFIPSFYADDLALPLASVGIAIAISRLLDIVTDPLIGVLSDRCRTRWGRRKPWVAAGTPLLMLSAWMLFVPAEKVSIGYLFGWTCLLFLAFTLVDLPYKAWGAELSTEYSERSRVTAWGEGFGAAGQMLFLAILMIMGLLGHHDSRDQLMAIAVTIVLTVPPLMALALRKVPERPPETLDGDSFSGWSGIVLVLKNMAFLRTVAAIVLFGSGLMIQATLHKLVLTHIVGRPELFAPMILVENLGALIALPLWMKLSDRFGKHRAVTIAAAWVGLWSLGFPFVGRGDTVLYIALIILRGCSFTSIFFLSNSIAADVVDHDTVESGRQRTGLYFAVWGMAVKLSVALGVLLGTVLPAAFDFEPSAATHTSASEFALMAVYGWLPCLIMALGAPFLWNFPIDRKRQQALRAAIAARRVDPHHIGKRH
ncbi:MAG: MFS transporter [Pseudomonadota bacterium]